MEMTSMALKGTMQMIEKEVDLRLILDIQSCI